MARAGVERRRCCAHTAMRSFRGYRPEDEPGAITTLEERSSFVEAIPDEPAGVLESADDVLDGGSA